MSQTRIRDPRDQRRRALRAMKRTLVRAQLDGRMALALSSAILELERSVEPRLDPLARS